MADAPPSKMGVTGKYLSTLSPYDINVNYGGGNGGIIRGTGADWFGPLNPMPPTAPPEVAGRQWDFLSGYNLGLTPRQYEPVSFAMLRAMAESWDILRSIIETRKDQVSRINWRIKFRDAKKDKTASGPGVSTPTSPKIKAATEFFERPDGQNAWPDWLRIILEDMFVIDAPALYMNRTRSGQLAYLMPVDGATIVPKIDDWGRTPLPYRSITGEQIVPVAYQQVLKGLPAVDYSVNDLIYRPRNRRSNRAYGYGPVEQIVTTVNIALNRQLFLLDYYTKGNIPDAFCAVPPEWRPEQIKQFQDNWDAMFSGDLAARRTMKFVPAGVGKGLVQTKEPDLKNEFDEWLTRIACYAFSVSPQGFTKQMNRASAQTQKQTAEEEGLAPILLWIKTLIDDLLRDEFNSPDLEFSWEQDEETDEAVEATILEGLVGAGIMSRNEARDKLGLDPDKSPSASQLMVTTATGPVSIDTNTIEGQQAQIAAGIKADPTIPKVVAPGMPGAAGPGGAKPPSGMPKKSAIAGTTPAGPPAAKAAGMTNCRCPGGFENSCTQSPCLRRANKAAGVDETVDAPFRPGPIAHPRETTSRIEVSINHLFAKGLKRASLRTVDAIRDTLSKAAKPEAPQAKKPSQAELDTIVEASTLDLGFDEDAALTQYLVDTAADAGELAYAQVGLGSDSDRDDIFEQLNKGARSWAADHAAELVSQIDETTQSQLRTAILAGFDGNLSTAQIADSIAWLGAFGEDRAALIASNEVATANSQGALAGYKAASEAGVKLFKEWLVAADDVCDDCQDNADAGAIDLEDDFPSGDDAPPGHPNCRCALSPVVQDDTEDDAE